MISCCDFSDTIQSYLADLAVVDPSATTSKDALADSAKILPREFSDSVCRDIKGMSNILEGLDSQGVREFLDLIEQCEGHLFLSGIGT